MKIFLYNDEFDMAGKMAMLHGYRLGLDLCHARPELIESKNSDSVYGRIVEIDKFDLQQMDMYHCTGLHVYERIKVEVVLGGGEKTSAFTYIYQLEKV